MFLRETLLPVLLVRHKVSDYATWMHAFLNDAGTRTANGSQRELFFRSASDPNEIWIIHEWDDLLRAQLYVRSDDLSDALVQAGVTDCPDYWYLEEGQFQ